jgi:pimeloyl-ACP methyl ester carboxylesterase
MQKIKSRDGTLIAYDRSGQGPAIVMVGGALYIRSAQAPSARAAEEDSLARHFSVLSYDRRGRGESGDTPPYAVEREVEDIEALINEVGGSAFLFGHSSGAVLALEAAGRLPAKVKKLAVYEPPFIIDDSRPPLPVNYMEHLTGLISAGQRGEAVAYFMTRAVGVPAEVVDQMRKSPMWPTFESAAHTLVYDSLIMGDTENGNPESIKRWASITVPTLVMDGGASPHFMHFGAESLARVIPNAQHHRFPGQEHGIPVEVLSPVLEAFFK